MNNRVAVVLAAGKGTRMESELPKVLVEVCGRPMIDYVLDSLSEAGVGRIVVVVGYRAELVREALAGRANVAFVEQTEQLGTGHAVMVCREELAGHEGPVLVVTGDSPMIQASSIAKLLDLMDRESPACILGTAVKDDPGSLGRVVRDSGGKFLRIVEAKDATPEELAIGEVNMSTYLFDGPQLLHALARIDNNNSQGEYYVTDCPGILRAEGKDVRALDALAPCESLSVNTVDDLAQVEAAMRQQQ